ncbi:MAG: preprotein translocase subunit SecE [Bacteroidia bacterium]|nr:preprotein translocase subunit SecE [Bacteroidia bacterium]
MEKLREGFREYTDELLNKVQWPTLEELQSSTVTVLIASLVIALVIFGMDFAFRNLMNTAYSLINL